MNNNNNNNNKHLRPFCLNFVRIQYEGGQKNYLRPKWKKQKSPEEREKERTHSKGITRRLTTKTISRIKRESKQQETNLLKQQQQLNHLHYHHQQQQLLQLQIQMVGCT